MYTKIGVLCITLVACSAQAHSGRTNAQGCHNDYKHGGYHCHGGQRATANRATANLEPAPQIKPMETVAPRNYGPPKNESVPQDFYTCVQEIQNLSRVYPAEVVFNNTEAYSVKIMYPTVPQTITCFASHTKWIEYHR